MPVRNLHVTDGVWYKLDRILDDINMVTDDVHLMRFFI